jgi:hypothetical protein
VKPGLLPSFFLLAFCGSVSFGQSSLEEYVSTNFWIQNIAFEASGNGQSPVGYEASLQPETHFFRVIRGDRIEIIGTSEGRLWRLHGSGILLTGIPDPSTPIPKLTQGQVEYMIKKQILTTGISFGFQACELGSIEFSGDSFSAKSRQNDHEPIRQGIVSGKVVEREGGRIKSLAYSSTALKGVTNRVTYGYSTNVHPFLPSSVLIEFVMDGQPYSHETRYTRIQLGITNTPVGGYVPSMWLSRPPSDVLLVTNDSLFSIGPDGKATYINSGLAGARTEEGWITATGVAWFIGLAAVVLAVAVKFVRGNTSLPHQ